MPPVNGKSEHQIIAELTNEIIDVVDEQDITTVLTILTNIVGQLIVSTSEGVVFKAVEQADEFNRAVKVVVNSKLIYDAAMKRAEQGKLN